MKVLRVGSWNTTDCPCCKQALFVVVAVPQERNEAMSIALLSGYKAPQFERALIEDYKRYLESLEPVCEASIPA